MNTSNFSESAIKALIEKLESKKTALENQRSFSEILRERLENQWQPLEESRTEQFNESMGKAQQLILLEIGIIESVKDHLDSEVVDDLRTNFVTLRMSNDLRGLMSIYSKHRDNVKLRQVLKLVSAVYKYNRDLIFGTEKNNQLFSVYKSRIKHATLCPHCGETAKQILMTMMKTKAVRLPS